MSFLTLDASNPLMRLLSPRPAQPLERALLSDRGLAFDVHPIGARPEVPSAVYAFAHRYGEGWWVLYLGATDRGLASRLARHHRLGAAIGLGATHLLVRATPAHLAFADEARLIDELAPPLNDRF
jgi:hypothetical protein